MKNLKTQVKFWLSESSEKKAWFLYDEEGESGSSTTYGIFPSYQKAAEWKAYHVMQTWLKERGDEDSIGERFRISPINVKNDSEVADALWMLLDRYYSDGVRLKKEHILCLIEAGASPESLASVVDHGIISMDLFVKHLWNIFGDDLQVPSEILKGHPEALKKLRSMAIRKGMF